MTALEDFIRVRVMAQHLHVLADDRKYQNRLDILEKAWWIYTDFDIISRSQYFSRNPIKLLLREGALKVVINGVNRVISKSRFSQLLPSFRQQIMDEELYNQIKEQPGLNKSQIASHFSIKPSELTNRLRKEMIRWNIIKIDDGYYTTESLEQQKTSDPQDLIVELLKSYPILTLSQISHLTGIPTIDLHTPISKLLRKTDLYRGLSRKHSPEEYLDEKPYIAEYDLDSVNWADVPPFVLEKRDAFVDLLRLEKQLNFSDGSYWLFVEGLPQAEFDLKRKASEATFTVNGFRKIIDTGKEINELIESLKTWAEQVKIRIEVNLIENPLSSYASSFVKFLVERGYHMDATDLVLTKGSDGKTSEESAFDWISLQVWYNRVQRFQTKELYKIIDMMLCVEDVNSLAIRLDRKVTPEEMLDFIYTSGINNRLGYISHSNMDLICSAYPKHPKLNEVDKLILDVLERGAATPKQLRQKLNLFEKKILARLYYLESQRLIFRPNGVFIPPMFSPWQIMEYRTEDGFSQSEAMIAIILDILKVHPPLTADQLGRYLGLTPRDLEILLTPAKKRGQVIEGYFIPGQDNIQLTLPKVLDDIEEEGKVPIDVDPQVEALTAHEKDEGETYEEKLQQYLSDINLIPQSDAMAQFFLPNFMSNTPNMAITKRLHADTKFWMILWENSPIGYILQYPTGKNLIDYDFEIKVIKDMEKIPILSAVIERFTTIVHGWNDDQLRAVSINDNALGGRLYEPIRFLLTSMGVRIADIDS